jgi:hypothetical protein
LSKATHGQAPAGCVSETTHSWAGSLFGGSVITVEIGLAPQRVVDA